MPPPSYYSEGTEPTEGISPILSNPNQLYIQDLYKCYYRDEIFIGVYIKEMNQYCFCNRFNHLNSHKQRLHYQ